MKTDSFRLALCAYNLSTGGASRDAFLAGIATRLERARNDGARLLVLPEYLSEAFLAWKPAGLLPTEELAWMAGEADALLPALKDLVARHGITLLAGSMPWPAPGGEGGYVNRAFALLADGREVVHDKLALTPFEKDPETWLLTPGAHVPLFEIEGVRMAILICLDVEMPALSCLIAQDAPDVLLVPSMTSSLAGYHRVFGCARARAVELMSAVAVCGVVGAAPGTTQNDTNVSGAALYLPCEPSLGYTGIGGELPPVDGMAGEEPYLVVDVPVGEIRNLRAGGAEVWPGAWSAAGMSLQRHGDGT
ncbi:nitrilase [Stappia stellulata]|uniref:nitrilase-related carbon-nitrogen hydrolase n=1 Tax=Stappia stellulata TaxID=71235 RepID=UPI001CD5E6F0|nr:nitrilase-related carbon-nitrogen hydrolase [Stappia stellulata]MCA1240881.1 nitrilase [Stappia stellulata]